jgi:hypothetical protein
VVSLIGKCKSSITIAANGRSADRQLTRRPEWLGSLPWTNRIPLEQHSRNKKNILKRKTHPSSALRCSGLTRLLRGRSLTHPFLGDRNRCAKEPYRPSLRTLLSSRVILLSKGRCVVRYICVTGSLTGMQERDQALRRSDRSPFCRLPTILLPILRIAYTTAATFLLGKIAAFSSFVIHWSLMESLARMLPMTAAAARSSLRRSNPRGRDFRLAARSSPAAALWRS